MESIIIEIKGAEGGKHSKLIVKDMVAVYKKVAQRRCVDCFILEDRQGFTSLLIEGKGVKNIFQNEAGGHRWQVVSPTDKNKRVHTSTVTVAVLDNNKVNFDIDINDIEYLFTRGTGAGGQHKNVTDSCVTAVHKPTKLSVKIDSRDQHKNKALATKILTERVKEMQQKAFDDKESAKRKAQVGRGMRADKRRTYRAKEDKVVDHVTNKKWKLSKWMKGDWK